MIDRASSALYVAQAAAESPRWLRFFKDTVDPLPQLSNRSTPAVLLVERDGAGVRDDVRVSALLSESGIVGRELRPQGRAEQHRSGEHQEPQEKTFDALSRLTRTHAVGEGTALQFGVDVEQDSLRAITGRPVDASLGARLTCADALSLAAPARAEELPARLGAYYARYPETRYKLHRVRARRGRRDVCADERSLVSDREWAGRRRQRVGRGD